MRKAIMAIVVVSMTSAACSKQPMDVQTSIMGVDTSAFSSQGRTQDNGSGILTTILVVGLLVALASAASCRQGRAIPVLGGGLAWDPGTC